MFFADPVSVKIQRLVFLCLSLESLVGCGGSLQASMSVCDPNSAPEVLSLTIQNTGQETLQNYPVAISLDETVFDFTIPKNASAIALWDATTHQSISAWLESYDATAVKALLWVKVPGLGPQASRSLLLTAGHAAGCAAPLLDGYLVFPFFSDVHDVSAWHATNQLKITDTVTVGPLSISGRSVIESDNFYNGFPGVAQAAGGDFVLAYKKGTSLRTVVDEIQGTQQASVLDDFGNLISGIATLPLAQGIPSHASTIQIGNDSTLRATDTQLDFVFVRPAAQVEPVVTVTRVR